MKAQHARIPEYHEGHAEKNGSDSKCPHQKAKEILY